MREYEERAANEKSTGVTMEPEEAAKVDRCVNELFDSFDHLASAVEEADDDVDPADIPGWTLSQWLNGLHFDAIVSDAPLLLHWLLLFRHAHAHAHARHAPVCAGE